MPEIITIDLAIALGLRRYFTGKPCKYGHIAERRLSGSCVECAKARAAGRARRVRVCSVCGSEFLANRTWRGRLTCGPDCHKEHTRRHAASWYLSVAKEQRRTRQEERICTICKTPFLAFVNRRTCGKQCSDEWRRTRENKNIIRPCEVCGTEFSIGFGQGFKRTCSEKCWRKVRLEKGRAWAKARMEIPEKRKRHAEKVRMWRALNPERQKELTARSRKKRDLAFQVLKQLGIDL